MTHKLRKISANGDDTVAEWETETVRPERLAEIEAEFNRLTKAGYWAADITDGRDTLVQKFDPNADILMLPRVAGGRG